MSAKKKIIILHTGGTFGMNLNGEPEEQDQFLKVLKERAPQIFDFAEIEVEIVLNKDSSNIRPSDWLRLAKKIDSCLSEYDGIVVTHGTDTMAFTTSVMSFLISNPGKPIIFTGSQRPLGDPSSDAGRNLIYSVQLAAAGKINEICLFFDSWLFRGNRVKKISIPSFRAFESPNHPPLATVGANIQYALVSPPPAGPYRFDPHIETQILSISLFPGLNLEFFYPLIQKGLKGLILQAFGPGDIPLGAGSVESLIQKLTSEGIPTVICSQAIYGGVDLSLYQTGRAAVAAGAISALDMTWEATLAKTMCLLGRGFPMGPFRESIKTNWAGELTLNG